MNMSLKILYSAEQKCLSIYSQALYGVGSLFHPSALKLKTGTEKDTIYSTKTMHTHTHCGRFSTRIPTYLQGAFKSPGITLPSRTSPQMKELPPNLGSLSL